MFQEIADGTTLHQFERHQWWRCLVFKRFNNGDVGDAATFAHRLEAPFFASSMQCMHKRGHKFCTSRTQWVAQCDGTTIDIELVWVSTCVLKPSHGYWSKASFTS